MYPVASGNKILAASYIFILTRQEKYKNTT
jgi:hypothetical protein